MTAPMRVTMTYLLTAPKRVTITVPIPVTAPHEDDHDQYLLTAPMRVSMSYTC